MSLVFVCVVALGGGALVHAADPVASARSVLANADYRCGVYAGAGSGRFSDEGFSLTNGAYEPSQPPGTYERPQAVLDKEHVAIGDLDNDGKIDAVAPVYDFGAGTGVFWTAHVISDVFGDARCTHAIFLGDRVELQSTEIQPPDAVIVDMMDHAPGEGMASRSMRVRRKFQLTPSSVTAFQQFPGAMWTPYRPEFWAVTTDRTRQVAVIPQAVGNPMGSGEVADAVWRMVTLSAAGDVNGVAIHELTLQAAEKPRRGDRASARRLNEEGLSRTREGQYAEAVKIFRNAASADPGDAEILNNLAYALLLAEDYGAAAQAILSTLVVAPSRPMAWETLGQILIGMGEQNAAVGAFRLNVRASSDKGKAERRLETLATTVPNPAVGQAIRAALAAGTVSASWATPSPRAADRADSEASSPGPHGERAKTERLPDVTWKDADYCAHYSSDAWCHSHCEWKNGYLTRCEGGEATPGTPSQRLAAVEAKVRESHDLVERAAAAYGNCHLQKTGCEAGDDELEVARRMLASARRDLDQLKGQKLDSGERRRAAELSTAEKRTLKSTELMLAEKRPVSDALAARLRRSLDECLRAIDALIGECRAYARVGGWPGLLRARARAEKAQRDAESAAISAGQDFELLVGGDAPAELRHEMEAFDRSARQKIAEANRVCPVR